MTIDVLIEIIRLISNRSVFFGHFDSIAWLHRQDKVQIVHQNVLSVCCCTEPSAASNSLTASFHREGPCSSIILDHSLHIYSYGFLVNDQSVHHWIRCSTTRNDLRSSIQFTVHRANHRISHQSLFSICVWCYLCVTSCTQAFTSFVLISIEQ